MVDETDHCLGVDKRPHRKLTKPAQVLTKDISTVFDFREFVLKVLSRRIVYSIYYNSTLLLPDRVG